MPMLAEAEAAETRSFLATQPGILAIDRWIEDVTSAWDVAEGVLFRARVCVAEIAANLLEHGSANPGRDEIKLSLQQRWPAIEVEISDTGREFDPTRPATYSAAAEAAGGHGLRLVRAYASRMIYRREGGRNLLLLRVEPAASSPSTR
jgi:anti-sigma regulatory factor (Ser/Thr protein kinase)